MPGRPVPAGQRVPAHGRPARGDRGARRGRSVRSALPDAARRDRHGQDVHDGQRHRRRCSKPTLIISHNKTLAAQLYEEMQELFPQQRGQLLRQLLRLLPARGVHPAARHLHREGRLAERRSRPAAPGRDQPTCSRATTSSSSRRSAASSASARRRRTASACIALSTGQTRRSPPAAAALSATCSTRGTTSTSSAARSACAAT